MKIQNPETKTSLMMRMKRIEGQARGIASMLEDERDCREIMQQLSAIHAAIQSTSRLFLQDYALTCMMAMDTETSSELRLQNQNQREKIIHDMLQVLEKTP